MIRLQISIDVLLTKFKPFWEEDFVIIHSLRPHNSDMKFVLNIFSSV